jgi:hypothetical protein
MASGRIRISFNNLRRSQHFPRGTEITGVTVRPDGIEVTVTHPDIKDVEGDPVPLLKPNFLPWLFENWGQDPEDD